MLQAGGLPTDKLQLSLQPLLVKTADKVLLFDTGAAANFGPTAGKLPASLAAAGVDPASVTDIFISHAHGDHVGGLVTAAGQLFFPNATIHFSAPEWKFLRELDPEKARAIGVAQHAAFVAALTPKVAEFAPGAELIPRRREGRGDQGPHPGPLGLPHRFRYGHPALHRDAAHHYLVSVQKPEWGQWLRCRFEVRHGQPQGVARAAGRQRAARVRGALSVPGIGRIARQGGRVRLGGGVVPILEHIGGK